MLLLNTFPDSDIPHFSRNPNIWTWDCVDANGAAYGSQTNGVRLDLFALKLSLGDILTVTVTEPTGASTLVTFEAVNTPQLEHEIQASNGQNYNAYLNDLKEKIVNHSLLFPLISGVVKNNKLEFRCLDATNGWSIGINTTQVSIPTAVTNLPATIDTTPTNYKVLINVFFEDNYTSNQFRKVAEIEEKHDGNSQIAIDVESIIHASCQRTEETTPYNAYATGPTILDNLRRYRLAWAEYYGEPPLAQSWTYSSVITVIKGGVSQLDYAESSFFEDIDLDTCLLSYQPNYKTIAANQPEQITWINYLTEPINTAFIELKQYSDDLQTFTITKIYENSISVLPYQSVCFPLTGIGDNAPLSQRIDVTVKYYNDALAEEALSKTVSYRIDRYLRDNQRYLQYKNSFSAPITLRCLGAFNENTSVEKEEFNVLLPQNYGTDSYERGQKIGYLDHVFIYRTGYMIAKEKDVLQEILTTSRVFELKSEAYIPLQLKTKKIKTIDTFEMLQMQELELVPILRAKNYSKNRKLNNPQGWLTSDNEYWYSFGVIWQL